MEKCGNTIEIARALPVGRQARLGEIGGPQRYFHLISRSLPVAGRRSGVYFY